MEIVTHKELCAFLKMSQRSLQRMGWRKLPHFFVGVGEDLRAARFVLKDVIDYLRENSYDSRFV